MNISVTEDINGQKYVRVEQEPKGLYLSQRLNDCHPIQEDKTDVLGKIRAEIAEYKDDKIIHVERNEMIDIVLDIIDKYKAESEET